MFGHNKGSGLFASRQGQPGGGVSTGPRQLTLVPSQGYSGNGMATIGMDNTFSVLAHLPAPHMLSPYSPAVYAAYLVDVKGKNGFYAGTLRAAGNGMFQANFRSPVPLVHYDKVVISLERPQGILQVPQGPIIMKVKEGMLGGGFAPVKKAGSDMWAKVKGFVGNRFGKKPEEAMEQPSIPHYGHQAGYSQQSVPQQPMPQQPMSQQPMPQGNYQQSAVPPGRNAYYPGMNQQRYYQPYAPQGGYQQGAATYCPPPLQNPAPQVRPQAQTPVSTPPLMQPPIGQPMQSYIPVPESMTPVSATAQSMEGNIDKAID